MDRYTLSVRIAVGAWCSDQFIAKLTLLACKTLYKLPLDNIFFFFGLKRMHFLFPFFTLDIFSWNIFYLFQLILMDTFLINSNNFYLYFASQTSSNTQNVSYRKQWFKYFVNYTSIKLLTSMCYFIEFLLKCSMKHNFNSQHIFPVILTWSQQNMFLNMAFQEN